MKQARKKGSIFAVLLLVFLLLPAGSVNAAAKYPKSIRLNKKTVSAVVGSTVKLKATVSPSKAADKQVRWSSSNPKAATVNKSGKVKIVGTGTAKITAETVNGKKAVCKVTGVCYSRKNGRITVVTPAGKRTYRAYSQLLSQSYYPSYGCVTTAVAIAASGFGKNHSPQAIHTGSASRKYSEKYAVKKLKGSTALSNRAAISVRTASQILKDMGIKNKAVYEFTDENAISQIRSHLQKGKPVIVKTNNQKVNGVKLANGHHGLVLVNVDSKDYVTFINPVGARINYAHGSNNACKLTLTELVENHMTPAQGNYKGPYVKSLSTAGGYILVG